MQCCSIRCSNSGFDGGCRPSSASETARIAESLEGADQRNLGSLWTGIMGRWICCIYRYQRDGPSCTNNCHSCNSERRSAEHHRNRCRDAGIKIDVWPLVSEESKPRMIVDSLLGSGTYGGKPRGDVQQ